MRQQVRIVVHPQILEQAYDLLKITQVSNLSDLFTLLLSRYAGHLKRTWVIDEMLPTSMTSSITKEREVKPVVLIDPVQEDADEDPVIARLSGLIDSF